MNKMTYKEFEKIIHDMGYTISPDYEVNVMVVTNEGEPLLNISKSTYKLLSLDWIAFKKLPDNDKEILADASWALASTPLKDREEQKLYHYRVISKYLHLFSSGEIYLNYLKINDNRVWISGLSKVDYWQTEFTEEECDELESDYDLSLFEKVEVTDEELEK